MAYRLSPDDADRAAENAIDAADHVRRYGADDQAPRWAEDIHRVPLCELEVDRAGRKCSLPEGHPDRCDPDGGDRP